MKFLTLGLIVLLATLSGCGPKSEEETVYREGEPPVSMVSDSDPEMKAARDRALAELPHFLKELEKPGARAFFIKVALPNSEGSVEHIWADGIEYKNGKFYGKLSNTPLKLPGRKLGDSVEATKDDISDWMIMDGEKMEGGYTAKLLLEREAKGN